MRMRIATGIQGNQVCVNVLVYGMVGGMGKRATSCYISYARNIKVRIGILNTPTLIFFL